MAKKASKKAVKKTSKPPTAKKAAKKAVVAARPKAVKKSAKTKVTEKAVELPAVQKELKKRWDVLNQQRLAATVQLSKVQDEIMQMPNVTGVHVGLRKRKMSESDEQEYWVSPLQFCIRVHVKKKFEDENDPRIHTLLPPSYGDVPVDVCQQSYSSLAKAEVIQSLNAAGVAGEPTNNFTNPIEGGVPIGTESLKTVHWGTLGGIVFSGDNVRYLTNRHVVGKANSDDVNNVNIIQPPTGTVPAGQTAVIGKVVASAPVEVIDAALIRPTGNRKRSRSVVGVSSRLFVTGVLTPGDEHQTIAFKVGAKTGLTRGIVKNTRATVIVNDVEMKNQIIVEPMNATDDLCDGGDSGAFLIVETVQDGVTINQVVGLVHAEGSADNDGQFRSIIACHFKDVQDHFGIKL